MEYLPKINKSAGQNNHAGRNIFQNLINKQVLNNCAGKVSICRLGDYIPQDKDFLHLTKTSPINDFSRTWLEYVSTYITVLKFII